MWKMIKNYFMPEYVSELDQFLGRWDLVHPELSGAQQREKDKYQAIYALRDGRKE